MKIHNWNLLHYDLRPILYFKPELKFLSTLLDSNHQLIVEISGTGIYDGLHHMIVEKSNNYTNNTCLPIKYFVGILNNVKWTDYPKQNGTVTVKKVLNSY